MTPKNKSILVVLACTSLILSSALVRDGMKSIGPLPEGLIQVSVSDRANIAVAADANLDLPLIIVGTNSIPRQ